MAVNYTNMRATANRLISENGMAGTLSRETVSVYDPLTDTETAARTNYNVTLIVVPFSSNDAMLMDIIAKEGFALSSVAKVLIPTAGLPAKFVPLPGDFLTAPAAGNSWTILTVLPILPDGNPIMHTCLCETGAARRG